ncbi:hypothetical protein ACE6H2_015579 [Prunus campanulata]
MMSKFWARSEINRCTKLDNSIQRQCVPNWSGWCIPLFWRSDFTQNSSNDSSHHIMMMHKFWARSEINRCTKFDNSSSKAVRALLEWLVYFVVLAIGFHSKLTKRLLPTY